MMLISFRSRLRALLVLGLCTGAGCGASEDVSIGEFDTASRQGSPCAAQACGPQPGAPAETCADGSPGGFTGRCLSNADGACVWEVRACPGGPPAPGPDAPSEGEIVAAVASFFQAKCVNCHGNGNDSGGLDDIMSVNDLRNKGLIFDTASTSPLFVQLTSSHTAGRFDPVTREPAVPPTQVETDYVRRWIDIGAPLLRDQCAEEARPSLVIRVRDEAGAVVCDASVIVINDGKTYLPDVGGSGDTCVWEGPAGLPGAYTIVVRKPGYQAPALGPYQVELDSASCHVTTVPVDVTLQPIVAASSR
ncbi:MAG TPA: carboxypeptidase-like regulatory domain-containing protein [Polyangiaceae bacterium]|nr:carboxypeptidase-like regulatory domain-containing protein [Polyangiaceae bacterium]